MKDNQVVYLVEGETEEKFIRMLLHNAKNKNGILYNGTIHKFNPYQEKTIKKIARHLEPSKFVILIVDTDLPENKKYSDNISNISMYCKKLIILKQKSNFEDEMAYICSVSKRKLFNTFNAVSDSEFKANYLRSQTGISDKFPDCQFGKYCSKSDKESLKKIEILHFCDVIRK